MNKLTIPREINKWLQTLDLSFKINNVRRDLSNGFIVAEILSRFPKILKGEKYEFDMRSFGIGLSMKEKMTNWDYLRKLFENNKIPISEEAIMQVINQAPNAAFELLCEVYKFLTKREKTDERDQFKQYDSLVPKYMRPIANTMLRDNEIQRIKDDRTRIRRIEDVLKNHKEFLNEERFLFTQTKSWHFKKGQKRKHETVREDRNRLRTYKELEEVAEKEKMENVQQAKNDTKKEEKVNLLASFEEIEKTLNDYNIENEFKEIIKKTFIETDHDIELELKKFSTEESEIIEFFFEKIDLCPEDKLIKIFATYEEKQAKFVDIIGKTLLELVSFLKFYTRLFDILVKNNLPVESFKNTTNSICLNVLSREDLKCEAVFLNYCLDHVLEAIKLSPVYRGEMCKIIFSLISNNHYSHYEVLQRIRRKFANKEEVIYYHLLVQCMSYLNEGNLDDMIFMFYESAIVKGINSNCDVIRAKSIYMVTQSMVYDQMNSLTHAKKIFKHSKSWNWEIMSLIVIYCSRVLLYYNSSKEDRERAGNMQLDESMKNELKELEGRLNELEKWEDTFLKIIDSIIHISSPNSTLKIGFIYLANILHYYPLLAEKYMNLVIEFNYSIIRQQVLDIEHADIEMEYTGNCLAEKYKICGAPLLWNPTYIAGVFRDYILHKNIQSFNETHLEILHSIILNQEFFDQDSDRWIDFYSDMKPYIFVAFSNKDFSAIALDVCQKFFTFEKIIPLLLENTFETFIHTMTFIYDSGLIDLDNDNYISSENMKALLTFISEIKTNDCQLYIYKLIKNFAIHNNDLYVKSNLLELMNEISQEQRGVIFD